MYIINRIATKIVNPYVSRALISAATFCISLSAMAQRADILQRVKLNDWNVGTGQFSGIAPMGDNVYAVVSDKEPADGFFKMRIELNNLSGTVWSIGDVTFHGNASPVLDASGMSVRDCEDVVYVPTSRTLFISGEGDQQVLEYSLEGQPTGRKLQVPNIFGLDRISPNMGFEALAYDTARHTFYTMTEGPLRNDGTPIGPANPNGHNLLRLQTYGADLQPRAQYAYRTESPAIRTFGTGYAFGVTALTVLPDGRLLVMERELNVPQRNIGATCTIRIFRVDTKGAKPITSATTLSALPDETFLNKTEVFAHTTRLNLTTKDFANYEGMCLGTPLADGTPTLLLISDSQGGKGNSLFRLKDNLLILALRDF